MANEKISAMPEPDVSPPGFGNARFAGEQDGGNVAITLIEQIGSGTATITINPGGSSGGGTGSVVIGAGVINPVNGPSVLIGALAGGQNNTQTSGTGSVIIGGFAGNSITTGNNNVFVGNEAGDHDTTGANNTVIGGGAGSNLTTGSNCVVIGSAVDVQSPGTTDQCTNVNNVLICDGTNLFLFGPGGNPLPTSDPGVSGALWVNGHVLQVSP